MAQMVIGIAVLDRVMALPIVVKRFIYAHYLQAVLMKAQGDNSKPFASLAKWALASVQGCPSIAVGQFASAAPTDPFSGDSFVYAKSISSFHLTGSRASFYGLFQAIGTKNTMV